MMHKLYGQKGFCICLEVHVYPKDSRCNLFIHRYMIKTLNQNAFSPLFNNIYSADGFLCIKSIVEHYCMYSCMNIL